MRRARLTYSGAFHHVMSRGMGGVKIFKNSSDKKYFLDLVKEKSRVLKIKIIAYCLLDTHYHLVIQNSSGKMGEFLKRINGQYGIYYRKKKGGSGYVFQSRFKSTVIQEGSYLRMSILYTLLNPVRAGIVSDPIAYPWSSIHELFSDHDGDQFTERHFIENLFGSRRELLQSLNEWLGRDLPVEHNRFGESLGDMNFLPDVLEMFDRRKKIGANKKKRIFDQHFKSICQIISEFENEMGVKVDRIDTSHRTGKQLRNELLIRLKDQGGLRYSQIVCLPLFDQLKCDSLGQLYRRKKTKQILED